MPGPERDNEPTAYDREEWESAQDALTLCGTVGYERYRVQLQREGMGQVPAPLPERVRETLER